MKQMSKPTLRVQKLSHAEGLLTPSYATPGSAGLDLQAACEDEIYIGELERAAVPTGLQIAIPEGFEGQVRARSGRALKEGLAVLNAPGTIDSDYRGEVKVILANLSNKPIRILRGEKIAQLVIAPVQQVEIVLVESLDETSRGTGGFGSTGR
jgi:dUTP pyrophosphatase